MSANHPNPNSPRAANTPSPSRHATSPRTPRAPARPAPTALSSRSRESVVSPFRRARILLAAWIFEIVFALLLLLAKAVVGRELGWLCGTCTRRLDGFHTALTLLWWVCALAAATLILSSVAYRRRRRRYLRGRGQLFRSTRPL